MAEDLTKGLNILLHPKFCELQQRVDRLEVFHKDLAAVVALKEERQEVQHLRDHVDNQLRGVDSTIGMVKDKMLSMDELREHEIRGLSKSVEQRATIANLSHLGEQVQAMSVTMSSKAETAKVEQVCMQFYKLSEEVALRATLVRTEQLAKHIQDLQDSIMRKVDIDTTDKIIERIKMLASEVSLRAEDTRVTELSRKFDVLADDAKQKADLATVEQVHRQLHVLGEDLATRVETRRVDHLNRQLHSLGELVAQKAEAATADQAIRQIHALSDNVAQKVDGQKHTLLGDQVTKLREDVYSMKAQVAKLDEHSRQLESLHNTIAVDSARVKHLCLLYAGAQGPKDAPHTPTTAAPSPLRPASHAKHSDGPHGGMLPSLGSPPSGLQRPGSVTLPSMASSPSPH